jgi:ureidoacrylate peracid hydrolase
MITIEARPEAVTLEARQAALLVIDMQNDFAAPGGMFERAGIDVAAIQAAALAIRLFWTRHARPGCRWSI